MNKIIFEEISVTGLNIKELSQISGGGRIARWSGMLVGHLHNAWDAFVDGHRAANYDGFVFM
ncbi:bacteriocin [Natronoflexus pectinivorans]|uniref:Bacteriocin-like protein n=1 Tax=Natronoflexus pectinivorans TaxID=682526 RepID=A0A4R2GIU6_9BACT|nr:bacteriocin [Natronoflexus pectinivorans]TCO08325.1 bacteriocin-like protein [Natronoflexus pectinivorans]